MELRSPDGRGSTRPRPGGPTGAVVRLPGGARLVVAERAGDRLWWTRVTGTDVPALLRRYGRSATATPDQPLAAYQTVFAVPSPDGTGSAEMPSAARPFTAALVAQLVSRGVQIAPITLHTGVASAEVHEPPYPEWYAVPEAMAWLVNAARAGGGRIVAGGTTAVRALETAVGPLEWCGPRPGGRNWWWPRRGVCAPWTAC